MFDASLLDPQECAACHPDHYTQWSGSMHAYAAADPVFLAMNARGQRETEGELGDFCVQCHAPVAVALGETTDGLNLSDLPPHLQGVTCFACHQVAGVRELHNNESILAMDGTMRGGIEDPVPNDAHGSAWSPLHDRDSPASSDLCGSCHDVVLDNELHLERTYEEWRGSVFANVNGAELSCAACHLPGSDGPAAAGGPTRRVHDHAMPGVDVALVDWPEREAQRQAVQTELDTTLLPMLCVSEQPEGATIMATLDNIAAGHAWPSGASQDRRAWVEVVAYSGDTEVWSMGVVADDQPVPHPDDPDAPWQFRDVARKPDGSDAHMFWDVADVASQTIPAPVTLDVSDPDFLLSHVTNQWLVPAEVDRVTLRVRIRPIGLDILDDLIRTGDLDPAIRDAMPVFDLGASALEWTPDTATETLGSFTCVR